MAEYREYISALKQCAKEHENENLFTGQIDTTALCNDTAKLLENDVIERSKIDKVIEEIGKESYSESVYGEFYEETTKIISVEDVLEILKRNIGE